MADQPFDQLLEGPDPLLPAAERLVVAAHRHWYEAQGFQDWSEPKAYHWLKYEDPDPIQRLSEGVRRLGPNISLNEVDLARVEKRQAR